MGVDGRRKSTKNSSKDLKSSAKTGFKSRTTSELALVHRQGLMHRSFSGSCKERRSSRSFSYSIVCLSKRRRRTSEARMARVSHKPCQRTRSTAMTYMDWRITNWKASRTRPSNSKTSSETRGYRTLGCGQSQKRRVRRLQRPRSSSKITAPKSSRMCLQNWYAYPFYYI